MYTRYRAGILSYVLAISLLVSVGLSLLTLYVYYSRLEYKTFQKKTKLLRNLESALNLTLGEYEHFEHGKTYLYDLFGQGIDSVSIVCNSWGLFDVFRISAFFADLSETRVYSVGHMASEKGKATLFLVDDGRPLSVAGDTKLIGPCYLPLAGIQSAYVGRVGYKNAELIYGEELQSDKELPDPELEKKFDQLQTFEGLLADPYQDTVSASFLDDPVQVSGGELTLNGVYSGQVFIKASERIIFDSLSRTSDIVAYAPVIEFKPGFEGDGQFFVTDTMIIHQGVELRYPTVLAAFNEDEQATIQTRGEAAITGWVLMDGDEDGFRRRVIYFEDGTEFTGMIYCNGLLETYADITGHVTVKRFLINAPTAVYENYLLNTTLDGTQLDTAFLALSRWFFTKETKVLKHLN